MLLLDRSCVIVGFFFLKYYIPQQKKSMKEKYTKAENVENLPSIEEIHGLNTPPLPKVVEVNSLMKFNDNDNPHNMHPSQCLYEFDNYIREQDHFNANVMK